MGYVPVAQLTFRENKPRNTHFKPVEIYALHDGLIWLEDGERMNLADFLTARFPMMPRALCITRRAALSVKAIVDLMQDDPSFNARFRLARRTRISHRDPNRKVTTEYLHAAFFGLYENYKCRRRGYAVRHVILDPDTFLRLPKHARPYVPDTPAALLAFGRTITAWCEANDLPVASSGVQIASALLRDKRFLPEPIRKVPAATNNKARNALVGHMFQAPPKLRTFPHLFRLDQSASHHKCAAELSFPHPDTLYGRGFFRTLRRQRWTDLEYLQGHHGLLYVKATVERISPYFPQLNRFGKRHLWITTNELPHLLANGLVVNHVVAAWTSTETDGTFNRYARWALEELTTTSADDKWWKKPLLLAPYGLLGVRRERPTMQADTQPRFKVDPRIWHVGEGQTITVYPLPAPERFEPNFCNVISRAMIERESRMRTSLQAVALAKEGWQIVMIDADAILVQPKRNAERPTFDPERWTLTRLDDVAMEGQNLVSNQVTKLPGIPGVFRENFVSTIRKRSQPVQERMNV